MEKSNKIRINLVTSSIRLTDCSRALADEIDIRRAKKNMSRIRYIRSLTKHPLRTYEDVVNFRDYLKNKGYPTIESWLSEIHGVTKEVR